MNATGDTLFLGRWPKATTREPGNLPPAVVTRERVGRGVPKRWPADAVPRKRHAVPDMHAVTVHVCREFAS